MASMIQQNAKCIILYMQHDCPMCNINSGNCSVEEICQHYMAFCGSTDSSVTQEVLIHFKGGGRTSASMNTNGWVSDFGTESSEIVVMVT